MSLGDKPQGVRWRRLCWQHRVTLHPICTLSEPGSGLGKHPSGPVWTVPGPQRVPTAAPQEHPGHSALPHRPAGAGATLTERVCAAAWGAGWRCGLPCCWQS